MQRKIGSPPSQFLYNGQIFNSPIKMATIMNKFFIDKVINLKARIPSSGRDPLCYLHKMMTGKTSKFQLENEHPDEVLSIIMSMKNSKATGLVSIDVATLKLVNIVPAITHIINLSISSSTFPLE